MIPEFLQPFVLLGDSVTTLQETLITALTRQRPSQPDCPDTDHYVEGSVAFWRDDDKTRGGDHVIVRISLCSMEDHRVHVGFREVFLESLGHKVIAQQSADGFWAKVQQLQTET